MPYLNQGEFYSEFGTFDVKITLPQDYRIMATGDIIGVIPESNSCLLYTSPSPRDRTRSRMPSSA